MDKRLMKALVMGAVLVCGCNGRSGDMPWSDPPINDGVAGTTGEVMAGYGGSGMQAGSGTNTGDSGNGGSGSASENGEACDPSKLPARSAMDAGYADASFDLSDGALTDQDAGVGPMTDPVVEPEPIPNAPRTPREGDVVVSELMVDPTALTDALGEWIELHNTTVDVLLLDGCLVTDDGRDNFVIQALAIPANGYVVLGRTAAASATVDLVYSGMTLTNTSDEVILTCDGTTIDRVAYGTDFPRPAGRTMQLSAATMNALDNDVATSWCAGGSVGTPRAENAVCAPR